MMKLRPLLKSKKGVSLESTVLFMMIISMFCFLLTFLVLRGHYQVKIDSLTAYHYAQKEQIGEDFVAYLHLDANTDAPENFAAYLEQNNIQYEDYSCEEVKTQDENITRYQLSVKRISGDNAADVIYIEAEKTAEGQVTVLAWLPKAP